MKKSTFVIVSIMVVAAASLFFWYQRGGLPTDQVVGSSDVIEMSSPDSLAQDSSNEIVLNIGQVAKFTSISGVPTLSPVSINGQDVLIKIVDGQGRTNEHTLTAGAGDAAIITSESLLGLMVEVVSISGNAVSFRVFNGSLD